MNIEIERVAQMLENAFNKQPWYGEPIMKILNNVSPETAYKKIGNAHSIVELVLHMTSWRNFVLNRLSGNNDFEITDETNFPQSGTWKEALDNFQQSQLQLVESVKKFPEEKLYEICPSKFHKYTYYTLIHGIIQHDIYHLGQIALLNKMMTII